MLVINKLSFIQNCFFDAKQITDLILYLFLFLMFKLENKLVSLLPIYYLLYISNIKEYSVYNLSLKMNMLFY